MSELKAVTPSAIDWPTIKVAGREFTLRLAYSANYQLARWGKSLTTADSIELAAAMAGSFNALGEWDSAGFKSGLALADLMQPGDEALVMQAVADALKKAYPELEVISQPGPGTTDATKSNESSTSGPSPLPIAV